MNKRITLLKAIVFSLIIIIPIEGFSWGVTGHRVVAEIAQNHLSRKAKKEIKKLLGNETLAEWANWPDFIKSDTTKTWKHTSTWHYVNMPGGLQEEEFIEKLKSQAGNNLYNQILVLKNQIADRSLSIEQRKTALVFLIHMVGDLHQPLHIGHEEDLGGNRIKVTWFDEPTNIHAVWDEKLVDFQQYSYTEYATILNRTTREQRESWQNTSLEKWFYESYIIADKIYAQTPDGAKLKYRYNYIFENDLNTQLLKGGIRLAKILNEVFQ